MRRLGVAFLTIMASTVPAAAQPLVCFGNEPSWGVDLTTPGRARVTRPDEAPVDYQGKDTRDQRLAERVWRSRGAAGGDLVVFLRETACSDTMSDVTHPFTARVSMPDGAMLAGCCRLPSPQAATTTLEGTSWRLVSVPGQAPAAIAALTQVPTARFESGRVTGFGGCNRLTGAYTLQQNRLTIGGMAGTMMACPEPAMSIEGALHAALTGTLAYAIAGDRLSLTADSGAVLLFDKEAAATLEGGTWEVTGFNNGRQAVVSPMTGTPLSVAFEKGTVTGQAGCNTFRATYAVEGSRITVGPAATTRKMCAENVMTQEREFLKALQSATTWSIDAGLLDLHRADGERVLVGPRRR